MPSVSSQQNRFQTIDAFCQKAGMSHTAFGKAAVNDGHFVRELRKGRRVWPETWERVETYMQNFKPETTQ